MSRQAEIAKARKRFQRFHGRVPDKIGKVFIPYPKAVIRLGAGVAIEYRSDKKVAALGDKGPMARGKTRVYRHVFGPRVVVFTDKEGSTLFITGGRFRVTDWMRD